MTRQQLRLITLVTSGVIVIGGAAVLMFRATPQADELVTDEYVTDASTKFYGEIAVTVHENGAPKGDVYVTLTPYEPATDKDKFTYSEQAFLTDAAGKAVFYSLPEGKYDLLAIHNTTNKTYFLGDAPQVMQSVKGKRFHYDVFIAEPFTHASPTPSPSPTPLDIACSNGQDDDKDTRTDLDDAGCATANGRDETDTFYAPENIKATYNFGQMTIQFKDRTQDENKFYLYRSNGTSTQFDRVLGVDIAAKTGINNTQTVKDTALPIDAEGTYAYAVTAAKSINGREVESKMSVQGVVQVPSYRPTAPTDIRATSNSDNSVTVTFQDQSSDERGFTIYRTKDLNSNRWTWVGGLLAHTGRGALSYTDTSLTSDDKSTYWYTVTSYKVGSQGNTVESVIKTADAARVELKGANLPTPTNLRQQGKKGVNLFWDHTLQPNDSAAGISLERSFNNGAFQEIGTYSAGTFGTRDRKAKKGRNTYRVRTYRDVVRDGRTTRIYSPYSNTITLRVN